MADDFLNMVVASEIGSSLSNTQNLALTQVNNAQMRAKNIEDNFGLKAVDYRQYQEQHGGSGALKSFGIALAGLAAGALFAAIIPAIASTAIVAGAIIGLFVGARSQSKHQAQVQAGYNSYLDGLSAEGRATRDQGMNKAVAAEYDNGAGKKTSFTADIEKARSQPATQGSTR